MKTSETLTKAAEIMIERGHGKGRYEDRDGRVCLYGACLRAATGKHVDTLTDAELQMVERSVHDHLASVTRTYSPSGWNDLPETTEAMALGALHEAALLAKAQGD